MGQAKDSAQKVQNARISQKTTKAHQRHARKAQLEHHLIDFERKRFGQTARTPLPIKTSCQRAPGTIEDVLRPQELLAQCPATDRETGQTYTGAIGVQQLGHRTAA